MLVIAVIYVHMNAVTIQMALASSEVMKVSCLNDVHYDGLSICSSFACSAKWKVVRLAFLLTQFSLNAIGEHAANVRSIDFSGD